MGKPTGGHLPPRGLGTNLAHKIIKGTAWIKKIRAFDIKYLPKVSQV